MSGYAVATRRIRVDGRDYLIRSLADPEQYHDPLGEAARLGITEEDWSLFGQVWPAGEVLAGHVPDMALEGRRVLELGAGLALASLVAHGRGANMTVSDYHPLIPVFLAENLSLNGLGPIKYQAADWQSEDAYLGEFDLIIGSDLLYQAGQAEQLAAFIDRHAAYPAEVLIVDPNRRNRGRFCREMSALGFQECHRPADCMLGNGEIFEGTFLAFARSTERAADHWQPSVR
jgi:predicted nicotinamide N-methyase